MDVETATSSVLGRKTWIHWLCCGKQVWVEISRNRLIYGAIVTRWRDVALLYGDRINGALILLIRFSTGFNGFLIWL